ncbi:hypothetical protein GCM10028828_13430 [Corynebacterium tapiri]
MGRVVSTLREASSRAARFQSEVTRVYTVTKTTKMITKGVTAPMTAVTFSTSIMPVISTSTSMITAPTHRGRPNCCCRLEPPPANMTKPMEKRVTMVEMSRIHATTLLEMRLSTLMCSLAW